MNTSSGCIRIGMVLMGMLVYLFWIPQSNYAFGAEGEGAENIQLVRESKKYAVCYLVWHYDHYDIVCFTYDDGPNVRDAVEADEEHLFCPEDDAPGVTFADWLQGNTRVVFKDLRLNGECELVTTTLPNGAEAAMFVCSPVEDTAGENPKETETAEGDDDCNEEEDCDSDAEPGWRILFPTD